MFHKFSPISFVIAILFLVSEHRVSIDCWDFSIVARIAAHICITRAVLRSVQVSLVIVDYGGARDTKICVSFVKEIIPEVKFMPEVKPKCI